MAGFLIIPDIENIGESLSLAEEYGFGFEYNDLMQPTALDDEENVRKITERYLSWELPGYCTMHGDFYDVLVFSSDKFIREISDKRIRQSIAAALGIGAKGVVFHTNSDPLLTADAYTQNRLRMNIEYWSAILEEFPQINIYIENMFDFTPYLLEELSRALAKFPNYGVCLDYAHASSFGRNVPIEKWVESLAPYVKHMHINDNDLVNDLHLPVGSGKIDWEVFKKYYKEYFSQCSILIETNSAADQRRSAEFLRKLGIL